MIVAVLVASDRAEYLAADLDGALSGEDVAILVRDQTCVDGLDGVDGRLLVVDESDAWDPPWVTSVIDRLDDRFAVGESADARRRRLRQLEWRLRWADRTVRIGRHLRDKRSRRRFPKRLESALDGLIEDTSVSGVWLYDAWVAAAVANAVSGTEIEIIIR